MTAEGMQEKHAMSQHEEWDMVRAGWSLHPEEARQSYVPADQSKRTPAEMDKQELEAYGRTLGIELDRRKSKANMLKDLERHGK
jgi:hypothetical protein